MSGCKPQPWEMPFDGAIEEEFGASFACRLDEQDTELQFYALAFTPEASGRVEQSSHYAWFGRQAISGEGGFVTSSKKVNKPLFVPDIWMPDPLPWDKIFIAAWRHSEVARVFFPNNLGELRQSGEESYQSLLVGASGRAIWRQENSSCASSAFSWSRPLKNAEFSLIPPLKLWNHIQEFERDPNGDATFAHQFAYLTDEQRYDLIFKWKRGDETQFKAALGDVLLTSDAWDTMSFLSDSKDRELKLSIYSDIEVELEDTFAVYEPDEPLFSSAVAVWNWFEPIPLENAHRRCVSDWMHEKRWGEVTACRPNSHELLEAHLRRCEWLASTVKANE